MKFSEIKPKTDYIVLQETRGCPLDQGHVFFLDAFGDLVIRNNHTMIDKDEIDKQIPASLEVKEYTDEDWISCIKCRISPSHIKLEEVAESFKQTAVDLAKDCREWNDMSARLYIQVSEWLTELKELRSLVDNTMKRR